METEECKGCKVNSRFCAIVYLGYVGTEELIVNCPCINCIVKVNCSQMCDERLQLMSMRRKK